MVATQTELLLAHSLIVLKNITASESHIRELDIVTKSSELVLQQAILGALTQTTQTPMLVLKLLH